ncbi:protein PHOTOPERIOD-INDEPENDENT EARLY FLOWERING 1 isoform X2 [Telopea speciosissima]|uniref:protein PHOTOPERIOD-INDEPENDENT EARLY FLOWERING 1 isoform X2 n=1 Tax=Telopea speciosissima TaxID=54955 RepID=UPI001CC78DE8|nr:protein PHOTOPERIOD-INDEPENDENT EARLY FLOWERING 1 isoform X2 [Telopea speciosissima]
MASKGPRYKFDNETKTRRQKALEAPREPNRRKTHWDHVLEEMVWLSKDFESERKWKLAQAKKVAIRASKNILDQATRGEKKVKEEEQRLRKLALNISKDVKKFWMKIEKLVLYKHQLELEEKKKKALDKQLDFLLGQTERYSTMLAENLVDLPFPRKSEQPGSTMESIQDKEGDETKMGATKCPEPQSDNVDVDGDYDVQSEDELEDDEHTIVEDEALITEEERREELAALQDEKDLPIEELLKHYNMGKGEEYSPPTGSEIGTGSSLTITGNHFQDESNDDVSILKNQASGNEIEETNIQPKDHRKSKNEHLLSYSTEEQDDGDYVLASGGEEKDDEATLSEEEELAKAEASEPLNEIELLKKESEMSVEELLARYKKDFDTDEDAEDESLYYSCSSEDTADSLSPQESELRRQAVSADEDANEQDGPGELNEVLHPAAKETNTGPQVKSEEERENENRIADAAAAARSAQPTGNTFSTTTVRTKFPFLLKFPLREYQHIGLDWLVTMYEKRLNGILADEMGLGKTIMTIALLAHLACDKGIWGPHLIVVPTSVMLNWETEFLKWCPAFKILTYFGSAKERKVKRQGWLKPNSFHVCITTYRLVIQDSKVFKRKKWKYLILDEAHLIKNWKSQRWQTLLNFNSKRRILLTGTPLQNDLMELWSLMHFLMPHIFQSHQEFKDWFGNPISGMVEGQEKINKEVIDRLHNVLRPFILRRLKRDVEKQLPKKCEHVIYCRLSKRQRNLYEDFIASSETQATLASANFFGMISIIMQLRKVCNHPDLFEGRPIISSFDMVGIDQQLSSSICTIFSSGPFSAVDLRGLGFLFTHLNFSMASWEQDEIEAIATPSSSIMERANSMKIEEIGSRSRFHDNRRKSQGINIFEEIQKALWEDRVKEVKDRAASIAWWNSLQCRKKPMYGTNLRELVMVKHPVFDIHGQKITPTCYLSFSSKLADIILSPVERFQKVMDLVESFMFAIPAARAPSPVCWCSKTGPPVFLHSSYKELCTEILSPFLSPIRPAIVRQQVYFPDRRLIQFDCGKLQELAVLLRRLRSEGHRALIFTQMTKMLDILEAFINLYGYTYMRLDGSTQPEERQTLMQRFNTNPKIFLFILSTRSGGVGINLVGADTVIFYDSDWNPAMDQQAQDRCHRIGQTREVHIYRLISECTIEENILKKANQKRALDDLVIQSGAYNTEFFKKLDPMELFSGHRALPIKNIQKDKSSNNGMEEIFSNVDVEAALKLAEDEADYMALKKVEQEEAVDNQEFTEETMGRLEDDEFVNEDDMKPDEKIAGDANTDGGDSLNRCNPNEEKSLTLSVREEDVDMLADAKQLAAAAAAAGQASSSFENQLRPIDQYAMRFLDLWDPIIDKSAIESQVMFEETEWELDRIEKFKEDMEAENDDDEEPLLYERWDADFATEAYRQQVEALAQRQLMEELEEAKEIENAEDENCEYVKNELCESKPNSKKKTKKKFKSLKRGALASESEALHEEPLVESMILDDEVNHSGMLTYSEAGPPHLPVQKKRKKVPEAEEEKSTKKNSKKLKAAPVGVKLAIDSNAFDKQHDEAKESKASDGVVVDPDLKSASRSKTGGKISITAMPVKRVMVIKPEKLKKKGNIWSRDCFPSPDSWSPQEDAILCAIVHEYSTHWSLASDALYGMTAGGFYRGRFRHPIHCCERFRELFQRYVLLPTENLNNEKAGNVGSGKALLKVTEDNVRVLLEVASEMADNELILQKHFTAVLSSVWRARTRSDRRQSLSSSSRNGLYFGGKFFTSATNQITGISTKEPLEKMNLAILGQSSKLVADALQDANMKGQEDTILPSEQGKEASATTEQLEITLEFQNSNGDPGLPLPSVTTLFICGTDPAPLADEQAEGSLLASSSCNIAEHRYRVASKSCFEGEGQGWASSAFPTSDLRSRSTSKPQSLGKHKASFSDLIKPPKSKLQRTTVEPADVDQHLISSPALSSHQLVVSPYPFGSFDLQAPTTESVGNNDEGDMNSSMDDNIFPEAQIEGVPHYYDPSFVSGLDDCILSWEILDIG